MSIHISPMGRLEEAFEAKFASFFSSESGGGSVSSPSSGSSSVHALPPSKKSSTSKSGSASTASSSASVDAGSGGKNSKRKKKKSKNKKVSKTRRPRDRLGVYDMIGKVSEEVVGDVQQSQVEGLEISVAQSVCDDSKPTLGEEAKSYFMMRHNFSYPGPWSVMVGGPNALNSFGYRVSGEVVTMGENVLVGTLQPNFRNVEGVWENTWNDYVKTHVSFMAGKAQTQQMGMFGPVTLPTGIAHMDIYPDLSGTSCARIKLDMMQKELSISYHRRVVGKRLSVGSKLVTNFEQKSNDLEFGASYKSSDYLSTWEVVARPRHALYSLFYTRNVLDNGSALTSRLSMSVATMNCQASFGYRYVFGRMNNQKMICGEISSDGYVRQTFTVPLLQNMMVKFYGEMNHFLKPQSLQRGEMPHRFGATIQIHL